MLRKIMTIHIPRNERKKRIGGKIRLTKALVTVLDAVGEEYGKPELRTTNEGLSVFVDDWHNAI